MLLVRKMFIVLVTVLAFSNAMFQASTCLAVLCVAYGLQAKYTPFVSPKTQEDAALATSGWLKALPGSGGGGLGAARARASRAGRSSARHSSIHHSVESGGSLKRRVMDYNVLETVLISSCVAIILGGMVFQSAALSPGTAGYVVLTIIVEAMIVCSLATFVVVLVSETRNTCEKPATPAKRRGTKTVATGKFAVGNPLHAAEGLPAAREGAVPASDDTGGVPRALPGRVRRTADTQEPVRASNTRAGTAPSDASAPMSSTMPLLSHDGIADSHGMRAAAGGGVAAAAAPADARLNFAPVDRGPAVGGGGDGSHTHETPALQTVRAEQAPLPPPGSAHVSVSVLSGPACGVPVGPRAGGSRTEGPAAAAAAVVTLAPAAARIQAARRVSVARRKYRARVEATTSCLATVAPAGVQSAAAAAGGPLLAAVGPLDPRLAFAAVRIQAARRGSVVRRQFHEIRRTAAGGAAAGSAGAAVAGAAAGPANRLSYVSPAGWQLYVDDDGDEFYYNARTLASQRNVPGDYKYVSPAGWTEYVDEEGDRFYYNVRSEEVTWERPRDHA